MESIALFESGKTRLSGYVTDNGRAILVTVADAVDGWVTVQAYEGQPFEHAHYGATDTITIPALRFHPLFSKISDRPSDLLGLALAAAKPQWCPGESIWLIGGPTSKRGAWLKNNNGVITLNVTGYKQSLIVYFLNMLEGEWKPARNLQSNYKSWATKARQAVEVGR